MRPAALLLCLLVLAGCAGAQSAVKKDAAFQKYRKVYIADAKVDPRKVGAKVRDRFEKLGFEVVLVDEDKPFGGNQGTGFIVSPEGHVLTAAHVVGDEEEATVWLNGKRYEAEVVYAERDPAGEAEGEAGAAEEEEQKPDAVQEVLEVSVNSKDNRSIVEALKDKDMALLKLKSAEGPFVPASFAHDPSYRIGEDVYTLGFPLSHILGDRPRLNKGLISSPVGAKDHPDFLQISAEIQPGNSGGPLFNEKGQVIGMVQMSLNPMNVLSQTDSLPQNVNFAAKAGVIREFLKSGGDKTKIALREGDAVPFETAQNSVVQIRSGIIPEGFKEEPKLLCSIEYRSFWDVWYRFQLLDIALTDADTGEVVLRAGQYGDNAFSTEDGALDRVFEQIRAKIGR